MKTTQPYRDQVQTKVLGLNLSDIQNLEPTKIYFRSVKNSGHGSASQDPECLKTDSA